MQLQVDRLLERKLADAACVLVVVEELGDVDTTLVNNDFWGWV